MILRRALGAGLAAVLAAGPALALPAPAVAATKPGYVAVVVSGHGVHCVKWKSGITGDTVLNDAATVAYRSDGLIVQIDGTPSSGTADASHFWSYWHDASGTKWSYSSVGASGYRPAAGSVEGWSYDNGKSSPPTPSQSPSGLYAKTCGAKDKKRPGGTVVVPATSSSPHPRRTQSTTSRASDRPSVQHRAQRSAPRSSAPSAAPSSSTPSSSSSRGSSTTTASTPRPATSSGSGPVASSSSPASSGATTAHAAPSTIDSSPAASSSSSGSPVGLFVVLGLVVVLAGGAGAVALRRRNP